MPDTELSSGGPDKDAAPVQVIADGATSPALLGTSEMKSFKDHLYIGTGLMLGLDRTGDGIRLRASDLIRYLPEMLASLTVQAIFGVEKDAPGLYDLVTRNDADLYVSEDGVTWDPVFRDGLGNPDNYGIRTMEVIGDDLYLGMANVVEGLRIYRSITGFGE